MKLKNLLLTATLALTCVATSSYADYCDDTLGEMVGGALEGGLVGTGLRRPARVHVRDIQSLRQNGARAGQQPGEDQDKRDDQVPGHCGSPLAGRLWANENGDGLSSYPRRSWMRKEANNKRARAFQPGPPWFA